MHNCSVGLIRIVKPRRVYQNEIDVVIRKSVGSYFLGGCDVSHSCRIVLEPCQPYLNSNHVR